MQLNPKLVGAGVAAAVATGLGYLMLSRRDEGFETLEREGAFSVRDYPALVVAETVSAGMRESALTLGFLALADYVAAAGRMRGPLFADGDDDGRGWRTRVMVPQSRIDALPEPGEEVTVRDLPARRLAAVRFAGEATDDVLDRHEDALRDWMRAHRLSPAGPVEHAFYDGPFTPGMLRRNEVLIPLAA